MFSSRMPRRVAGRSDPEFDIDLGRCHSEEGAMHTSKAAAVRDVNSRSGVCGAFGKSTM